MDLHDLRQFMILAETLHFGRASQLGVLSPSALSRCIMRLEDEVGEKLFIRDNRRVHLTRAGELFRAYAQETLKGFKDLRDSLESESGNLRGEISLFASVTACYSILPLVLPAFRRRYPDIHILLKTGDEAQALDTVSGGEVDACVTALPGELPRGVVFREITRTPLVFVAPTIACPVREMASADPVDWGSVPMVLSERGLARRRLDAWFRARGIRPRIYAQVSGNEALLSMVSLGCGVGVVPRLVLEKSPLRKTARELRVEPALEDYVVGMAALERRLVFPAVKALWDEKPRGASSAED
jgi:LysR family transcriptional regulator, positive regulator for ilvC